MNNHNYFLLNTAEHIFLIPINDVLFVKSDGMYSQLIGIENQEWETSKPISAVQTQLENSGFCRIHRSFIVNIHFIRKVDKAERVVHMAGGQKIPCSKTGLKTLVQLFKAPAEPQENGKEIISW